jgi:two-component system C4-dicarboxylate transport response regulator DctD
LNVASLTIPPLKDRREDILPLFQHYAFKAAEQFSRPQPDLSPAELTRLLQHDWPGNVRELKNAADRFVLGISETQLASLDPEAASSGSYDERMELYERQILEEGLVAAQGQLSEAAERLSLTRKTLYRKLKKHQLDKQQFKGSE